LLQNKTAQACQDSLLTERAVDDDDLNATVQTNCDHKQNNKLQGISQPPGSFTLAMGSPKKMAFQSLKGIVWAVAVGPSVNLLPD
jgi:hypothetical protein